MGDALYRKCFQDSRVFQFDMSFTTILSVIFHQYVNFAICLRARGWRQQTFLPLIIESGCNLLPNRIGLWLDKAGSVRHNFLRLAETLVENLGIYLEKGTSGIAKRLRVFRRIMVCPDLDSRPCYGRIREIV